MLVFILEILVKKSFDFFRCFVLLFIKVLIFHCFFRFMKELKDGPLLKRVLIGF